MRQLTEFAEALKVATGLELTYHHWKPGQVPKLPYLVYYSTGSDDFKADNLNYIKFKEINIEFYSNKKDESSENKLTTFFDSQRIAYESYESYIEDEKMYEVLYEITI